MIPRGSAELRVLCPVAQRCLHTATSLLGGVPSQLSQNEQATAPTYMGYLAGAINAIMAKVGLLHLDVWFRLNS